MNIKELELREHAIQRMFERNISFEEIKYVIENGEIIKEYPEDKPYPSFLIMGKVNNRVLHVVMALKKDENKGIIITVYEPEPGLWDENFKRRKK